MGYRRDFPKIHDSVDVLRIANEMKPCEKICPQQRERESLIYLRFENFNLNLNELKKCHLIFFLKSNAKNDVVLDLILILILGSKRHCFFYYYYLYKKLNNIVLTHSFFVKNMK